jgi:uncharacterized repeat protein (TIGR01451 family)
LAADGATWFTEFGTGMIGRIDTTGAVTEFPIPTANSGPLEIASGEPGDSHLYFTENTAGKIGIVEGTTPGSNITEFAIPTANSGPTGITEGPDGFVWFTETDAGQLGRISSDGQITEFSAGITPGSRPTGIAQSPSGALAFAESAANQIGQVTFSADLSVTKTVSAPFALPGQTITYTIVATNAGPDALNGVAVIDAFPAGLTNITWTATTAGGATTPTSGTGNIDEGGFYPAGGSVTYTITATVGGKTTGVVDNTVDIFPPSDIPDPNAANNEATATFTVASGVDLSVTKTDGRTTVVDGSTTTYTIVVRNKGTLATSAGVTDTFPAGLTGVSWTVTFTGGATGPSHGTGNFSPAATTYTMPAGSTVTITVLAHVSAAAGSTIANTVTVDVPTGTIDVNPADNTATDTDTVVHEVTQLYATGAGPGGGPHVKVFNAAGKLIFSFFAYDSHFTGGVYVATGDVNGDGVDDIITGAGAGGGPHVKVFNGVTGGLMYSFFAYAANCTGGVRVAAGDVNGDGHADIITGAGPGGGPHVEVFSGVNLGLLGSFFAYASNFTGGVFVAGGDVNGDGKAEVITGAGAGGGPHVRVLTAAGTQLASFFAFDSSFTGGVRVAAGDVNGDGKADIITSRGPGDFPEVRVFNSPNAAKSPLGIVLDFNAYDPAFAGGVFVASADLNGDGFADIITGAGPGGGPHVKAFSGKTGGVIASFFAYDPTFLGGVFVG